MTRAEVIAMARGVGIWCTLTDVACAIDALERFAALVAEAEREALQPDAHHEGERQARDVDEHEADERGLQPEG